MAEISFSCPQCGGNISMDEMSSGKSVLCPYCEARITVVNAKRTITGEKEGLKIELRSEQTIATTVKSRHSGEFLHGEDTLQPIVQKPDDKALTASAYFRKESKTKDPESKSYKIQGCLPVLLICIGAFISLYNTVGSDYTTSSVGVLLIIFGIVWAFIARRISTWRKRR